MITTGIGSIPHASAAEGAAFVLDAGLSAPFWPQLPKRGFLEQMIPQYAEGMPCVSVDLDEERTSFDASAKQDELMAFYEKFLAEDPDMFPLGEACAAGFHAFARALGERKSTMAKGQVTGPITFGIGITDAKKTTLYADPELLDAAVKLLSRKAQWQIRRLKELGAETVIMFVDEPVLSAYGSSAMLGVSDQDVCRLGGELFQAIADAGGMSGIHVCGNSDWGVIIRSGVQIVNFDAYQFGPRMALYADDVKALFERGGSVAWGIVPTSDAIENETIDTLAPRLQECVDALCEKGFSEAEVKDRSMLTPSCGTGSLTVEQTGKVFRLLADLRARFE
jgi:hypothetical protein